MSEDDAGIDKSTEARTVALGGILVLGLTDRGEFLVRITPSESDQQHSVVVSLERARAMFAAIGLTTEKTKSRAMDEAAELGRLLRGCCGEPVKIGYWGLCRLPKKHDGDHIPNCTAFSAPGVVR